MQQQHGAKSLRVQRRVFFSSSAHISYFHTFQHRKWVVNYVCIEPVLLLMCFPPSSSFSCQIVHQRACILE